MLERERERERERESSDGWEEKWMWEREPLDDKSILIKNIYEYLNKIKWRIDNLTWMFCKNNCLNK